MPIRGSGGWIVGVLLGVTALARPADAQTFVDSVRPFLVFAPAGESWFVVASRGKRMLLDIGRVDLEVRKDSALAAAYRDVVTTRTPVPIGTMFTLRAPWGEEPVRAAAVDTWNGRIVLVLEGSTVMDSAARGRAPVAASAWRVPGPSPLPRGRSSLPPPPPSLARPDSLLLPCDRTPVNGVYAERVQVLRDSLDQAMRALGPPTYERLARRVTASSSQVTGCFGAARVALAVSLRAGTTEWTRERVVLVDTLGRAHPLAVDDLRFKVHDLLLAADFDGDGLDDLATIGRTHGAGGTTLLRYDAKQQRLVRLAAGFVWEDP